MKRLLVLIDVDAPGPSAGAVGFARDAGVPFDILWSGEGAEWTRCGSDRVLSMGSLRRTAEDAASIAAHLMDEDTSIAGPSTVCDVLARIAEKLDLPMLDDVDKIDGETVECATHGGRVRMRVTLAGRAVFSVSSTYPSRPPTTKDAPIQPVEIDGIRLSRCTTVVSRTSTVHKRPPLNEARVIVAGGRSLGDGASFEALIGKVADKLGAAVAASGGAVHSGIAPAEQLVGQTGQTVAPDLYIAVGISGADQHVGGMNDSRVIVAINRDPHASIFRVADYGLVADLRDALPELAEKL